MCNLSHNRVWSLLFCWIWGLDCWAARMDIQIHRIPLWLEHQRQWWLVYQEVGWLCTICWNNWYIMWGCIPCHHGIFRKGPHRSMPTRSIILPTSISRISRISPWCFRVPRWYCWHSWHCQQMRLVAVSHPWKYACRCTCLQVLVTPKCPPVMPIWHCCMISLWYSLGTINYRFSVVSALLYQRLYRILFMTTNSSQALHKFFVKGLSLLIVFHGGLTLPFCLAS